MNYVGIQKPIRGWILWYTTALLLVIAHSASGWCPPQERDQLQDQFFKCVRTMDAADQNGDDRLDYIEYENYVKYLALTLYVVPLFKDGLIPEEFEDLFGSLVQINGGVVNENGAPEIDIYGSNINDVCTFSNAPR